MGFFTDRYCEIFGLIIMKVNGILPLCPSIFYDLPLTQRDPDDRTKYKARKIFPAIRCPETARLQSMGPLQYRDEGDSDNVEQGYISSNVIIDFAEAFKVHPKWKVQLLILRDGESGY